MSHFGDDNSSVEEVSSAEESYNTEFRSYPDDAWYSVRVSLEGERGDKLRVKYENFPEEHDNVFLAEGFKSEDELYDFIGRFRKVSAQLQDRDCYQIVRGMRVCASDSLGDDDNLFYDAIVDEVVHKKHSNVNGQEECECTFLLFWLHGPNVGNVVEKGVANICLLQSAELEPKLATFMEIATQKIEKALCKLGSDTIDDVAFNPVFRHEANGSPIVKQKLSSIGRSRQGKCSQRSLSKVWPSEAVIGGAKIRSENRQDTDIGGDKKYHMILVQNLEKELSSSTVLEFILKQTSIASQVYIFPSLPWELYTNGVIVLDCRKDLEQLFGFLDNPNHFVVSSNGRYVITVVLRSSLHTTACRPWVAAEKMSMNDHWTVMLESPKKLRNRSGGGFSNELKLVCFGSEEYKRAKELRDLFLQFIAHQQGLYKKLCMEERSIAFSSNQLVQLPDKS
ncbi:hypothetical protein POUND7_013006 [Theobroma cacao]